MARRRSRRRIAITALVAVLAGSVVGLALTGAGAPASALRLLTGDAWLANNATGTVSHVSGYSGRADADVSVGKPGDPFAVVQRSDGAYLLDLRTGRLLRLDDSTLAVAATTSENGRAAALQVVAGPDTTWVVDHSSGIVERLNPLTLAPMGPQIALGGPTGAAAIDASGSLWVPVPGQAVVDQVVSSNDVIRHPFGQRGDRVQVADTGTGVWGVDPETAIAASLQNGHLHQVQLPALPVDQTPLLGSSTSSANLVVVAGTEILDVDTSLPSLSSVALSAGAQVTQVAVSQQRAYLLDPSAHQLETVALAPLQVLGPLRVPPGSNQLISKDELVFVNSSDSPQAVVVNAAGVVTDVTKYVPAVPTRARRAIESSQGVPGPVVAGNPLGPAGGGAAPVSGFAAPPTPGASPPAAVVPPSSTVPPPPVTTTPPVRPGGSSPPVTAPPPTVPGPPIITLVSAGDGVVTASWSPPASDGGSPVLRYVVTAAPSGASRQVAAPNVTATLTGLPDGVRQCVQVQAVNQVGGGPFSPGLRCATPVKNSPGQVQAVQARPVAPGQIGISWSPPSLGPDGTAIQSYTVRWGSGTTTVDGTSAVVNGLASDTAYSFTVVATNQAGNSGPASVPVDVTTWSPPGRVTNLVVAGGDEQLTISWGPASVPAGNPAVTGYEVSIGGGPAFSARTPVTRSVRAWTNETVTVYAVNAVGNGLSTRGSGTAWERAATVVCYDTLSGDRAIENDCTLDAPGQAWVDQGASGVNWVHFPVPAGGRPAGFNEYLCTTYYTGTVSGDRYALVTTPSDAACTQKLPQYQAPDTPHPIAYVSTTQTDSSSQHVCEYRGTTTGANGPFTSYELSLCNTPPAGLKNPTLQFSFYT